MSVNGVSGNSSSSNSSANTDRMNELTMTDFIKMMVAELENQDPMNPMSNTDMLSQISQIRQITSNDKLTTSIESLTMGQALSTASGLIGKTIVGVNSLGKEITGTVDKVTIENGVPKLYVGSSIVEWSNVTSVVNNDSSKGSETGTGDGKTDSEDSSETDSSS